jgi:hypothetical protein
MATKKKDKKKATTSKKTASKKSKPVHKRTTPKKAAKNKKKAAPKKAAAKKKSVKPAASAKATVVVVKNTLKKRPARSARAFSGEIPEALPGSGDLQGLSNVEDADSESVDELLEEGNAFEAGVVSGVEEADDHDGQEVRTREVPEDDVPGEYLDED